ncbi:hypothetical protein [Massilia sp. TN1-12]|uniref:hypothetical protein n=1 Tax=Massilia paldalensis TaxID=3377675 RepID=UPI00384CF1F7
MPDDESLTELNQLKNLPTKELMDKNKLMEMMLAKKQSLKKTEKTAKLEAGENRVVILPGWRAEDPTWYHDFGQHFIKDEADQIKAVYLCTHATFEKDCAVCSALAAATRAAADDALTEVLGKAKASRTVLVNALMLDSKEPNTPVILELKRGIFEQILDIVIEYEGKPLDPDAAIILKLSRDGKGLNTKYSAMPTAKTLKVPAAVLGKLHNLDDYVKQESEEQERRAIGAINSVAGVLPAPGTGADTPRTRPSALAAPKGASTDFEDVPDFDNSPSASAVTDPSLDSDIDALLGELPE